MSDNKNPIPPIMALLKSLTRMTLHGRTPTIDFREHLEFWFEKLDEALVPGEQQRIPMRQYVDDLIDNVHTLLYLSDGGYTRISIDLAEDPKLKAAELTPRSRKLWKALQNGMEEA